MPRNDSNSLYTMYQMSFKNEYPREKRFSMIDLACVVRVSGGRVLPLLNARHAC